ncbi:MAG: aminoglycoside phosphotransferase family protein [Alphaproteobacteria bacterium]|nr:aminoglycoside phosphotransferase family protein [Alphaproteobacteria bacterium]MBL6940218.1 aminoglycoside phosphotransferase family protein [Alphaproteobacteria bacterium]MBL7096874.1 aminoglycoside phosphotransferase family protein [Alphaproteobacteria bacterium]
MGEARVYSERLGAISDAQFQAVAERFGLGRFVSAAPTTGGLFGQNLFLTTTDGEFVLRGAPHWVKGIDETEYHREDRWQFTKERWFAQQLHERTKAPVPWPMHHDTSDDIFGWPYLMMPKMPGMCTDERGIKTLLEPADRRAVAVALGETLAEMQRLTWPFAGDFSPVSIELEPYAEGAVSWIVREASMFARMCGERLTHEDRAWIDTAIDGARGDVPNTYVHCDYKFGNLTLLKERGRWHVSGLFDFHEARFSDGALDLVRSACSYLDTEPELARVFRDAYGKPLDAGRMTLYAINDRLKFWEHFTKPGVDADWLRGTFRGWAQRYVDGILTLL